MTKRTKMINRESFRKAPKRFRAKPLAIALFSVMALAACADNQQEEVAMYRDAAECKLYNPNDAEMCETSFRQAQLEALETAPRFATREDCVAEFGEEGCAPVPESELQDQQVQEARVGGSFWMPLMAGYLFGRMSSGFGAHKPLYAPQAGAGRGNVYDASGKNFGKVAPGQKMKVNPGDLRPAQAGQTLRRGGFGQVVANQNRMQNQAAQRNNAGTKNRAVRQRSFGG